MTSPIKRLAALLILCVLITGCGGTAPAPAATDAAGSSAALLRWESPAEAVNARGGYVLRAAVLHSGQADACGCAATLDYLRQSLVLNLEAEAVGADAAFDLSGYDMVFLDESLLSCVDLPAVTAAVMEFARAGGGIFAPNEFYDVFPSEFFGAASFAPLDGFPETLSLSNVSEDLKDLQELISDFHRIYSMYLDAEALRARDYGYAMLPDTAEPLVYAPDGKSALYAMNRFGEGVVFFTNALLPNDYSLSSFSLTARTDAEQSPFACSTASCNQLILSRFAAYVSKQLYGFSLGRVFGAYGTPGMSWELHYEDITAMEHDSIGAFEALCEAALQPVSFSVVRNPYVWYEQAETLTYALNRGGQGELSFAVDREESAYSSGKHIASGGVWLQGNALQNCESYFVDAWWENYRYYPCIVDYDGDGNPDAFCGSADGKIYYYHGQGFRGTDGRLSMDEAVEVSGVAVPAFSAPQLADLDGDGEYDLIAGASDGLLRWYRGEGGLRFTDMGTLLDTEIRGQCLPCVGDINGDGVIDLAVGSDQGILLFYYGTRYGAATAFSHDKMSALTRQCADYGLGVWLSPGLADLNNDGITDLALGVYSGYVAVFLGGDAGYDFVGFITAEDMNYQGNHNLKFGHWNTPVFTDLNGDGALDLLCGHLEYGMAYPVDSDYFPFREQLQAQLYRAREKDWYVGVHYLSGLYHSAGREKWELDAHLKALGTYGLTDLKGANQHTWHLSSLDPAQSLRCLWDAGLLWESGFEPGGANGQAPQLSAENAVALPFFLMDGDERTLLVQNCSLLLYRDESLTDLHGRYGMPVLPYYHCDMIYKDASGSRAAVSAANAFRYKFSYNFVKEDQLMYSIAASYNLAADAAANADGSITLTPRAVSTDFPLYDETFQNASGLRIDFAEAFRDSMSVDASVWYENGGALFVGMDRPVTLRPCAAEAEGGAHLRQVNIPAEIRADGQGAILTFRGGGMMEAVVEGSAAAVDEGWTVSERDGRTTFTKFGGYETLRIEYE